MDYYANYISWAEHYFLLFALGIESIFVLGQWKDKGASPVVPCWVLDQHERRGQKRKKKRQHHITEQEGTEGYSTSLVCTPSTAWSQQSIFCSTCFWRFFKLHAIGLIYSKQWVSNKLLVYEVSKMIKGYSNPVLIF